MGGSNKEGKKEGRNRSERIEVEVVSLMVGAFLRVYCSFLGNQLD